ncbi:maleylpyruvate isomerase family mycothiol-dependent enzyme [Sphaerisporangium aureirubrum]|uniref:Maleylpyruvate isomerase family mycothiol-dependent enzyme n=1 Tax=Sphaerisporangium aureirubrum TaxID=1544736 RepID=A0ABW1NIG1_9ACTN
MVIFDDLVAEQDRFESVLAGLTPAQWLSPSSAEGWSVTDVVLHLAQGEEGVTVSVAGPGADGFPVFGGPGEEPGAARTSGTGAAPASGAGPVSRVGVDELMDRLVRDERAEPAAVFARWRTARAAAMAALRAADPHRRLPWVAAPMRPAALATTRLAEHWAHALDITVPLGIDLPDTSRLRHVAWLAHRTLPYALALAGEPAHEVCCELTSPDGTATWSFGPPDAESCITGPAAAFCRVAAQRLASEASGLKTSGPHAATALRHLRTYAA